jgi:hypothetical protein
MVVDPAFLQDLSVALGRRAGALTDLAQSLTQRLGSSTWTGPAADRFRAESRGLLSRLTLHGERLAILSARVRSLSDELSLQLSQLRGIEVAVQNWYAQHPPGSGSPIPWPTATLPPAGDPEWRQVERAFQVAGIPLHVSLVAVAPAGPPASGLTETVLGLPVTPAEKWIIDHEDATYNTSAYNPIDTPTGHAFGLGQLTEVIRRQYLGSNYNTTDPALQLQAMRDYIMQRYGTAEAAVAFWQEHQWY